MIFMIQIVIMHKKKCGSQWPSMRIHYLLTSSLAFQIMNEIECKLFDCFFGDSNSSFSNNIDILENGVRMKELVDI